MGKKWYIAAVLALAVGGAAYYWGTKATPVEGLTVGKGEILRSVTETGYVQASQKVDIYAAHGGRIRSLGVSIGQRVEKGQVLMVLENKDLVMSAKQLQIQLSQAQGALNAGQVDVKQLQIDLADVQAQFSRAQELYNARMISTAEYDAARSALSKAQTGLEARQNSLQAAQTQVTTYRSLLASAQEKEKELQIKSPVSGTLMRLPAQVEMVLAGGALLAQVASATDLEIKANLLSDDLGEVQIGQKVQITAPVLGGQGLEGEVLMIYPQAEEEISALGVVQRRVPTIIKLDSQGNLKPGYEVRVNIITASQADVVLVPREAVLTGVDGQKKVFRIVDNRVKLQAVTTGLTDNKHVEIKEGLQPGERILKDASVEIPENTRVKG